MMNVKVKLIIHINNPNNSKLKETQENLNN